MKENEMNKTKIETLANEIRDSIENCRGILQLVTNDLFSNESDCINAIFGAKRLIEITMQLTYELQNAVA